VTPRPPLPGRILIPVANPATAEELIRIGAALLDPRAGELTALGIVEVPEEMPLSEGATKARQARRLLQKVLDYAPEGTHVRPVVRIGRRAAQGIVEAAVELEADLVIFGWGGRPGGRSASGARGSRRAAGGGAGNADTPDQPALVFSPTIDAVVRESPCDIAVVKQRPIAEIHRILVPVRGGPHAELALSFADALARRCSTWCRRASRPPFGRRPSRRWPHS
jgi:glucosyl-3-phosphoglycerate synthase